MQLFSASFQMSYGIVAVLLLLGGPLAEALLARWPLFTAPPGIDVAVAPSAGPTGRGATLLGTLGIGLASSLVSTISSIQFFGLFTPGSLAVNLVLIPISTFVIGAGFISLLCGFAGFAAGSVLFNHAGVLLLWLMDRLLRTAMAVPGVYQAAPFRAGLDGSGRSCGRCWPPAWRVTPGTGGGNAAVSGRPLPWWRADRLGVRLGI